MVQTRIILVEPESSGNIGFIARIIENFAMDELFLVNPQCEIEEQAKNRAVHAQKTLESARIVDTLEYALKGIDVAVGTTGVRGGEEHLIRNTVTPKQMVETIPEQTHLGILFGREGKGLSNDELKQCDFTVSIPTAEQYPVMNLSHAVAVLCYECFNGTSSIPGKNGSTSSREQQNVLENLFKDATEMVGWEQHRREKAFRAFKNMVGRSYMTNREIALLLGLFRDMRDRMRIATDTDPTHRQ